MQPSASTGTAMCGTRAVMTSGLSEPPSSRLTWAINAIRAAVRAASSCARRRSVTSRK
jgi:hypothetical protein